MDDDIVGTWPAAISSAQIPDLFLNKKNCELDWAVGNQLFIGYLQGSADLLMDGV